MKKYIFGALIIIIGLLILFAPFGYAHICPMRDDGSCMKCHWMGEAVRMLGGLITVMGLVFCICKRSRFGIAVYNIGSAVCLFLLTTVVIGTCKHAGMSCNMYTKPVIMLLGAALLVVNGIYLFLSRKDTSV